MAQPTGSEPRIAMRVDPQQKALIERGARARGLSVTDFMLSLALREAEIALSERTLFALSDSDYEHFQAILDRPAEARPDLKNLIERNRKSRWKVTA